MNNKPRNNNAFDISNPHEFFHRKWHGGLGFHPRKNHGGGAFGITKKEWHRMVETRNRINKAKRKK